MTFNNEVKVVIRKLYCEKPFGNPSVVIHEIHQQNAHQWNSYLEVCVLNSSHTERTYQIEHRIMRGLTDSLARWTDKPFEHISAEGLAAAYQWLRQMMRYQWKLADLGKKRPAYKLMQFISDAVGYPEMFKTDMTHHDALAIALENPQREFYWSVRRCGSDIGLGKTWTGMHTYNQKHDSSARFFKIRPAQWSFTEVKDIWQDMRERSIEEELPFLKKDWIY